MGKVLESLKAGNDVGHKIFYWALTAGSLKWVEKLMAAGLNLQSVITGDHACISLLADLDPQGFAEKIKGIENKLPNIVDHTTTEAGKKALTALVTKIRNNS